MTSDGFMILLMVINFIQSVYYAAQKDTYKNFVKSRLYFITTLLILIFLTLKMEI